MTVGAGCTPLLAAAALCALATGSSASNEIRVPDLDGRLVAPLSQPARAAVLLFLSVDCPISSRYAPEIQRLQRTWAGRGVTFWLVFPNPAESNASIGAHLESFGYPRRALRDPTGALVRRAEATVTPEAAIFDRGGARVYRGRIDNRFVRLGLERPAPTVRDLDAAIGAALDGRPVEPATTHAVGCFLADVLH
ncbi:MAG: hypothetical protein FJW23_11115 [Acidimicrobiia bacterium]|nr:hypothetical protein [Acidimicrobiia bacterium]